MKHTILILGIVLAAFTTRAQTTIELFNGQNLDGWHAVLDPKSDAKPEQVFGTKDGVLTVSGQPFGYLYTDGVYTDFRLHVEWRYLGTATNSGIFLFVRDEKFWPNCVECQLKAGHAGDLLKLGGAKIEATAKTRNSSENPVGEWNVADIISADGTVTVFINGVLQNRAAVSEPGGHIALQSEGGPLEFRHLRLTPLK